MRRTTMIAAAATVLALVAAGGAAQLGTRKALTLEAARRAAAAAEEYARSNRWNVAVTILDESGQMVYFARMDGVQLGSIEVSRRKAESALKFRRPSKAFAERVLKEPHAAAIPGAFPYEGGLPLLHGGDVVGAIGVSGATNEQDGMAAGAGAAAVAAMMVK